MWFLINANILWIMWVIAKLKFKSEILKSVLSIFFFFVNKYFLYIFFHAEVKESLKLYQLNIIKKIKKDYKKACERYQNLSKEEKEKNSNMAKNSKDEKQKKKI